MNTLKLLSALICAATLLAAGLSLEARRGGRGGHWGGGGWGRRGSLGLYGYGGYYPGYYGYGYGPSYYGGYCSTCAYDTPRTVIIKKKVTDKESTLSARQVARLEKQLSSLSEKMQQQQELLSSLQEELSQALTDKKKAKTAKLSEVKLADKKTRKLQKDIAVTEKRIKETGKQATAAAA